MTLSESAKELQGFVSQLSENQTAVDVQAIQEKIDAIKAKIDAVADDIHSAVENSMKELEPLTDDDVEVGRTFILRTDLPFTLTPLSQLLRGEWRQYTPVKIEFIPLNARDAVTKFIDPDEIILLFVIEDERSLNNGKKRLISINKELFKYLFVQYSGERTVPNLEYSLDYFLNEMENSIIDFDDGSFHEPKHLLAYFMERVRGK